jgi:restriction system protein
MALWLFRAGKSGEFEGKFLHDGQIYLTWERLNKDLRLIKSKIDLFETLLEFYPEFKRATIRNWTGQVYPMANSMKAGDWIVLPSKLRSAFHFGEIKGDYEFHPKAEELYRHSRKVEWFAKDIPRSIFDQDLLYSLGAIMTVCQIRRNDAEERIRAMYKNNWKSVRQPFKTTVLETEIESSGLIDLEEYARDQIAKYIIQKYKGHGMAMIIEAILKAKGYITYRSPEGPDKGIDILAAPEPLGFGKPRLCVQVKTGDTPIDRPTMDQLLGTMQNFKAEQGLLVSWAGFKTSVDKEIPSQFFSIRLWDQSAIINELLSVYDKLSEDLRAELPLKRIWTLNIPEDEVLEEGD